MHFKRLAGLTGAILIAGAVSGMSAAAASAASLQGAGSTLVAPIEAEWATAWDTATGNTVSYDPVGSGTGLKDIGQGVVDFGASDAPISASTTACPGCFQVPWALSATGVSFNVPGVHRLHLTGSVIAKIWLGQITNWNNSAIKKLNKGTRLPNLTHHPAAPQPTAPVTRTRSPTTCQTSAVLGAAKSGGVPSPASRADRARAATAGWSRVEESTPGAIAYVAVSYLIAHGLPAAAIQNASGATSRSRTWPTSRTPPRSCTASRATTRSTSSTRREAPRSLTRSRRSRTRSLRSPDPFNGGNSAALKSFVDYASQRRAGVCGRARLRAAAEVHPTAGRRDCSTSSPDWRKPQIVAAFWPGRGAGRAGLHA